MTHIPLNPQQPKTAEMAERMALNAPIQGSAADIVKVAMLKVDEALRAAGLGSRMLLQVHDELVLEVEQARVGVRELPFILRLFLLKLRVLPQHNTREELLLEEGTLKMVWTMRRMLSAVGTNEGIELLLNRLAKTDTNVQFLGGLTKSLDA